MRGWHTARKSSPRPPQLEKARAQHQTQPKIIYVFIYLFIYLFLNGFYGEKINFSTCKESQK